MYEYGWEVVCGEGFEVVYVDIGEVFVVVDVYWY